MDYDQNSVDSQYANGVPYSDNVNNIPFWLKAVLGALVLGVLTAVVLAVLAYVKHPKVADNGELIKKNTTAIATNTNAAARTSGITQGVAPNTMLSLTGPSIGYPADPAKFAGGGYFVFQHNQIIDVPASTTSSIRYTIFKHNMQLSDIGANLTTAGYTHARMRLNAFDTVTIFEDGKIKTPPGIYNALMGDWIWEVSATGNSVALTQRGAIVPMTQIGMDLSTDCNATLPTVTTAANTTASHNVNIVCEIWIPPYTEDTKGDSLLSWTPSFPFSK